MRSRRLAGQILFLIFRTTRRRFEGFSLSLELQIYIKGNKNAIIAVNTFLKE